MTVVKLKANRLFVGGVEVSEAMIKAAPDMYEALETADRMMWALGACDSIGHQIIKSALAKAQGEEIK